MSSSRYLRKLSYTSLVAMLAIFLQPVPVLAGQSDALAVATFVTGKVYYVRGGKKKKRVRIKTIFSKNDVIFTKKGKVNIQIGKKAVIRLSRYSYLKMAQLYESGDTQKIALQLKHGRAYSKIFGKLDKNSEYKVSSPTFVAAVRGTEFLVSEHAGAAKKKNGNPEAKLKTGIYVNRGEVATSGTEGSDSGVNVRAGEQVLATTEGIKKDILDKFAKRKMEIFAKLDCMKEKNYELLKAQRDRNKASIDRIKQQNEERMRKMKGN